MARGVTSRSCRDTLPAALDSFPPGSRCRRRFATRVDSTVSGAARWHIPQKRAFDTRGRRPLDAASPATRSFENVERDLALGIMRSHFHHEYPKGTHCCVQCTLAVYPVLEAGAIRYFDCGPAVSAGAAGRSFATVSGDLPGR